MGLPALKHLGGVIHPSLVTFSMRNFTINCIRDSRRISFMIVNSDKMDQIIVKQARNKKDPSDVFVMSLHFAEDWHPLRVPLEISLINTSNNSSRSWRM